MNVLRVAAAVEAQEHAQVLRKYGLTVAQYQALDSLASAGTASLGSLADTARCSRGNLTGIMDRLEASGWIRRERSTEDRRVIHCQVIRLDDLALVRKEMEAATKPMPPEVRKYLGDLIGLEP